MDYVWMTRAEIGGAASAGHENRQMAQKGMDSRVRHGFANPCRWVGTGTGRVEVTRPKPISMPWVWRVWFRRDDEGFTLFTTSKREWSRGTEGLGVEMGVNEGDRASGIEMEGIPLLL